ncbi:MAG TPA: hypothetical protein VMF32_00830 [Xanthobacteraceae bacterium]|nr:hypothetical protein [Xanthobacteraceae bacterium]
MPKPPRNATPIFSRKQLAVAIEALKNIQPNLWEQWKEVEISKDEDQHKCVAYQIYNIIIQLKIANTLNGVTSIFRTLRTMMRAEAGLWIVGTFTASEIHGITNFIKSARPDLWKRWRILEKRRESFFEIQPALMLLLREAAPERSDSDLLSLLHAEIRREIRKDADW